MRSMTGEGRGRVARLPSPGADAPIEDPLTERFTPLEQAVAFTCRYRPPYSPQQYWQVKQLAQWLTGQGAQAERVRAFRDHFEREDWRGRKGERATPKIIRDEWDNFERLATQNAPRSAPAKLGCAECDARVPGYTYVQTIEDGRPTRRVKPCAGCNPEAQARTA